MDITFKTLSEPTLLTEFCKQVGYSDKISDEKGELVKNPVSEADFATQFLKDSVANYIKTYEVNHAIEITRTSATADADAKISAARKEVIVK